LPDEDVTAFCLWLKNDFQDYIGKVTLSKRLRGVPAVVYSNVSSSMRMVMQMME
jgi:molecular chaperone HtpG/TNF receptor-associated protein 1